MFIELLRDWLSRAPEAAAWATVQDTTASSWQPGVGRQVAGLFGILLLVGLWLRLSKRQGNQTASLAVLGIVGIACGAGTAIGMEPHLALLQAASSVLVLAAVFAAITRGWREGLRMLVVYAVAASLAVSTGTMLAQLLSQAGPTGEFLVRLLVAPFF